MDAMLGRKSNLIKVIEKGTPVVATFLYQAVVQELDPEYQTDKLMRQMALTKYVEVILQAKSVLKTNNSLKLVIVDAEEGSENNKRLRQETFAHIKLEGGVNEAICYADTATTSSKKVTTHLVVINGEEVAKRRNIYDTSVSTGWDPDTSLLRLLGLVIERDNAENVLKPEVRAKLLSLHDVQAISSSNEYDTKSMKLLGKGSFGEVYKVFDRQRRVFALKMLKELEGEERNLIEDFKKEAKSLENLSHPNIVKLEKVERQGERLFLKLEYVDGFNLREIIKPRGGKPSPQPKEFVLRCATQVGEALKYIHAKKVVHRDLKADNVMVTGDKKTFKLTDFGLARITERSTMYSHVGTMRYMAPEVTTKRYTSKADVYSYALLLIETIEGRNIFEEYYDAKHVYQKKVDDQAYAPVIPLSCNEHGTNMVTMLNECLKPHAVRASMEKALSILAGKALKDDQADVQLLCLGTGQGTTTVLHGEPSSSLLVLRKGKPMLLVDVGLGVIRSYRENIGNMLPPRMFITHNHCDHAAELALGLILTVSEMKKHKLTPEFHLYCGPEVQTKLMEHRFDEIYSACPKEEFSKYVTWYICEPGQMIAVDEQEEFHLTSHKSQHSEVCYGFTLYRNGTRLFGFTADSGFNQEMYDNVFKAPMVIVDARTEKSYEHASFGEVVQYMKTHEQKSSSVYVIGYGTNEEGPDLEKTCLNQMRQGDFYNL
ncbi:tyrosine-protein kinase CSK-like [Anneissia japonica]|uniref:tyrosine-protein kinase CSK-like n=1 Tax=Anneissia japonica TaxID=1529436 RepID=UPI001425B6DD|nr:tyrosine-protein kinase CSK-like [Anneissia japonica]